MTPSASLSGKMEQAVLGAGCFWCIEAVFQELKGVESVESGYMGGEIDNPTYAQICTGTTGHAEVARITYDATVVSYKELLEVFWQTHNPTTLNQQGEDNGTQYRSAVFYLDETQKQTAEIYMEKLDRSGAYANPVVTEISEASIFFPAENYHQDYYLQNANQGYCQFVIKPKLDKFRSVFGDKLK